MTEKLNNCPVCKKNKFSDYLEVTDWFLSRESFSIQQCDGCGFRFVNPRPGKTEIGRYYQSDDYISHGVEKTDLISRIYGLARHFSIHRKYRIVKKHCRSGTILDIGCGTGEFLSCCQKNGFMVEGVEPNEKARQYAQAENKISVSGELNLLNRKPRSFECITMWHVLEHIHDLENTLQTVKNLLTPDGVFIVAVPNSNSWDASQYKHFWAAYDVPRHLYHFTETSINDLASRNGFEVKNTLPQKLDAFYVSMLSEKYRSGSINYFKAVIFGFWSNLKAKKRGVGHSSLIFILSQKKR